MLLKCIAIDDEPLALELIHTYIGRRPDVQLIHTFEDAISGAEYLSTAQVDLIFMDINMPDISGIDLAKALKSKPMLIFTTAFKQFAFDGFELEAVDYLLKPIDYDRFSKALDKAIEVKKYKMSPPPEQNEAFIYVHSAYQMIKIVFHEVEYIESMEDYIKIHLKTKKTVLTLMTLKRMMGLLPDEQFKRIHRSYIVSIAAVKAVQHKKIHLIEAILPIGESYAAQVKSWIKNA
ncbi:LytTR family DNA-binding domain-containing protein [Pedobacter sp. PLR]|uniref:LytR/AlgR family response regulator transcription factor n=1 Tax=Pedobacter sp. PLR TaxID=2994465 RepID=UPI002245C7E0|nr:LytTR family DNA-binding domain-containing protein [Pedobacter sp. PLR]MCX2449660.1 LytTR family DNA-binding domain-containing protein [Pedobacter sp. PLR]